METGQQKVKNALREKFIIFCLLISITLFGGWQSKSDRKLNDEQYNVLNSLFKRETILFQKTSTNKSWGYYHTEDWLLEKMDLCLLENENDRKKIVKELMNSDFQSNLKSHISNQTIPSQIEELKSKNSGIKLIKKDISGTVPRVSAPFIFEDKALVYFEDPFEESIFYLKKDQSGNWEWICKFTLFIIFED